MFMDLGMLCPVQCESPAEAKAGASVSCSYLYAPMKASGPRPLCCLLAMPLLVLSLECHASAFSVALVAMLLIS